MINEQEKREHFSIRNVCYGCIQFSYLSTYCTYTRTKRYRVEIESHIIIRKLKQKK